MNILAELRQRFTTALAHLFEDPASQDLQPLLETIRPAGDPKHGDYQANCAMQLRSQLDQQPRQIAEKIVAGLEVADLCEKVEVAGPGFINLRLRDDWLAEQLTKALGDARLGVPAAASPKTYVVDFSAPNVAKPMHVGHIRSTAIGNSLAKTLRFLGHTVITDNHIGDWGTQFGMIIYGYRHFLDQAAYQQAPVPELARLYRLVRQLCDYHDLKKQLPKLQSQLQQRRQRLAEAKDNTPTDPKEAKKHKKQQNALAKGVEELGEELQDAQEKIARVEDSPALSKLAAENQEINQQVLQETAKLHAGDQQNRQLWEEILPPCLEVLKNLYRRLGVQFDHTLGESFYHDQLPEVVEDLQAKKLARQSDGAMAVFFQGTSQESACVSDPQGNENPMLIRKRDGAFLYATTDLATVKYRMETWQPDAILYVVDFRQGQHFDHLFAACRLWGYTNVELTHVKFGTVLDKKTRKPYKTRSGDTVGLESLLDGAIERAREVVEQKEAEIEAQDDKLSPDEKAQISEVVGLGAIFYADLSHNRESDYCYDEDEMLALDGNTAAYMQYGYARLRSIFRRGNTSLEEVIALAPSIQLSDPAERALALQLLAFPEALEASVADYRPNLITSYLWDLTRALSRFYAQCVVLKAPDQATKGSRLALCALTALTLRKALELLGIRVLERM